MQFPKRTLRTMPSMKSATFVAVVILAGCGARSGLGDGSPDASTEPRDAQATVDAHDAEVSCTPRGTTPVKLADIAGPITDSAAVALAGSNVYFVVTRPNAIASTLFSVPAAGGALTTHATDVVCAGVESNGAYVGYSSTNGRFVALPLGGGAALSVETEGRAKCPMGTVGNQFLFAYESSCCVGNALWVPPGGVAIVPGSGFGLVFIDDNYVYGTFSNQKGTDWQLWRAPIGGWGQTTSLAPVAPGSRMLALTTNEVVFGPATGPVFRVAKSGGDPIKVTDSIGSPRVVDDKAIYAVGINSASATTLGRVGLGDGLVETLAKAKSGAIAAIGVDECNVAWIETDPPALMIRSK